MKPPCNYSIATASGNGGGGRKRSVSSFAIILCFMVFVFTLYGGGLTCVIRQQFSSLQQLKQSEWHPRLVDEDEEKELLPFAIGKSSGCNIFEGEWVYDEASRPLYAEEECPYIQPQLMCQAHGRPDAGYQHWRWQPRGCPLPSFNATMMLEMLRGKRMMFVGDSLNRGQFISMVCLLHRNLPESGKSMESFDSDSLTVFRAKDYNATIEFYWAPFLVESNSDDAVVHRVTDRIVRVGSINKHARHWTGVDILVFNTYLWWMGGPEIKTLRGPFGSNMNITVMASEDAYRLALGRMLKWTGKNMDPKRTRVFFTSMSPSHHISKEWGGEAGGNCYNQTSPIKDPEYWGSGSSKTLMRTTGEVLSRAPVMLLNITQLSEYRKDAHTQIYKKQWNPLTPEQLANPTNYADCIHWCLPGLQDTWNELLYAKLFFP